MINKVLIERTDNGFIQFFRYGFVAVSSAISDFITLFILTEFLGVYYLFSAIIAYVVGFLVNYAMCIFWVFNSYNTKDRRFEFIMISLVGVVGLVLTTFFIWFFTESFQFHYLFSKILATMIVFLWNFSARKYIVFRKKNCNAHDLG